MVPCEPDEFDYETNASAYSVSIRATDEYGAFTEGNFTLTLLDVNESIDLDPDQNQTAPPADHNTTVPVDNNGTNVDIDQNGTLPIDHNTTTPSTSRPRIFPPACSYRQANGITSDSAILQGRVLDDRNATISERGFFSPPCPSHILTGQVLKNSLPMAILQELT